LQAASTSIGSQQNNESYEGAAQALLYYGILPPED
jgi:hypothetical protein